MSGRHILAGALAGASLALAACALPPLPQGAIDVSQHGGGDPGGGGGDHGPGGDVFFDGDSGIPGGDETYQPVLCDDVGTERAAVPPAVGELVINEVFANPSGADLLADWFEIYVAASQAVDLNDLELRQASDGESPRVLHFTSSTCRAASPGSFVVIGASEDPDQTRGAPVDWAPGLLQLFNAPLVVELWLGDTLIDTAGLPAPQAGVSSGLNPSTRNAGANDDPAAFCDATSTTVFDETGTPGAENDACP